MHCINPCDHCLLTCTLHWVVSVGAPASAANSRTSRLLYLSYILQFIIYIYILIKWNSYMYEKWSNSFWRVLNMYIISLIKIVLLNTMFWEQSSSFNKDQLYYACKTAVLLCPTTFNQNGIVHKNSTYKKQSLLGDRRPEELFILSFLKICCWF